MDMAWKPDWSQVDADPRLDEFRDALAEVTLDGQIVGYLTTQVHVRCTQSCGHLWWRRWSDYHEELTGLLTRTAADSRLREWEDWIYDPRAASGFLDDLRAGRIVERDYSAAAMKRPWQERAMVTYSLRWLLGEERASLWNTYASW
jgi:hypothetical protein